MKRFILCLILIFNFQLISHCADEWDKTPVAGSDDPSTIDDNLDITFEALDRLLTGYRRGCRVMYTSTSSLTVDEGEIVCSNSGGTIRKFRSNTSTVTVTSSNLDVGSSFSSDTTYYIYAVADEDATTFTILVSESGSAPTGATYYALICRFDTDGSSNIEEHDVRNFDINGNYIVDVTDTSPLDRPGFSAYRNASKNISDSTWSDVSCDTEEWDYGNDYNTTNGKFTCDVAGKYLFVGVVSYSSINDGSRVRLAFYKNGGLFKEIFGGAQGRTGVFLLSGTPCIIDLDVDDYVELYTWQSNGGSEAIVTGSDVTFFQGQYIGR